MADVGAARKAGLVQQLHYACALARARLVMTALEACGDSDIGGGSNHHPQIYWADALEQVERDDLGQLPLSGMANPRSPLALMSRPETRIALKSILLRGFHAVVGNPPFDAERDPQRRAYHREQIGRSRRYVSASGSYALGAVFVERFVQLTASGGYLGLITANTFMTRKFGKPLIEQVLRRIDLAEVVDSSGAYIPGPGIATILLFARNRLPASTIVRVVMSKRGEQSRPEVPSEGRVWRSIVLGHATAGFENEFVSVANLERTVMTTFPWSLGGGGAAELKSAVEQRCSRHLADLASAIGRNACPGEEEIWSRRTGVWAQLGVTSEVLQLVVGESVRDWGVNNSEEVFYPYVALGGDPVLADHAGLRILWPWRHVLGSRSIFGKSLRESGRNWWSYIEHYRERMRFSSALALAEFSTHNQAATIVRPAVFMQNAPIVCFDSSAPADSGLMVSGVLNSSSGDFLVKSVAQGRGAQGIGRGIASEKWEQFVQRSVAVIGSLSLPASLESLVPFTQRIHRYASERREDSLGASLSVHASGGPIALRAALSSRRERDLLRLFHIVALQEELDWLCYKLYGIDPDVEIRDPESLSPLRPGLRPFEITLAQEDCERLAAVSRGEEPDEQPTAWFSRHGWEPFLSVDALSPEDRRIAEGRIERTAASRDLALVEQPTYKRRWYMPKYEEDEREAMEFWLADKIEAWTRNRKEPFTVRQAAAALRADPGLLAVGDLLTGRADFDIDTLVGDLIRADAVPNLKHHVFKPDGLLKHAAWEETWRLQHEEDAGKTVTPAVPPKYERTDYLKPEYWSLRGKLDVPKERFIAFTEVPPPTGEELLYGWAGWTHKERAHVLLALDEQLEGAGVKVPDRYGVLYGVWFLLPYVAWEAPDAARDFRADVKSLVGESGVTEAMLTDWAERFPLTKPRAAARGKKAAK